MTPQEIDRLTFPLQARHKFFDGHEAVKWHGRRVGVFHNADGTQSWRYSDGKVMHFDNRGFYLSEEYAESIDDALERCGKRVAPRMARADVERLVDEILAKIKKGE